MHGHKASNLQFADDIALLSHTGEGLLNLLEPVNTHSKGKHLIVNQ